jgi:hypothetical protein
MIRAVNLYAEIAPAIEAGKASGAAGLNALGSALLLGNRRVIFERTAALGMPAVTTNVSPASPSSWSG